MILLLGTITPSIPVDTDSGSPHNITAPNASEPTACPWSSMSGKK